MIQLSGFQWSPDFQRRMRGRLEYAQKVVDATVLRFAEPYTPHQTGGLAGSAIRGTRIGSGLLVWDCPQAHYLYEGRTMGPNIPIMQGGQLAGFFSRGPKRYTGGKLKYHGAPQRGARWVERMKGERMREIVSTVEAAMRQEGTP